MISQERDQYRHSFIHTTFCINRNLKTCFGCKHDTSKQKSWSQLTQKSWSQLMHHRIIYKNMPNKPYNFFDKKYLSK